MSIMIAEVYEALVEAGACPGVVLAGISEEKAKAAAGAVPAEDRLP